MVFLSTCFSQALDGNPLLEELVDCEPEGILAGNQLDKERGGAQFKEGRQDCYVFDDAVGREGYELYMVRIGYQPGEEERTGYQPGEEERTGYQPGEEERTGYQPGEEERIGYQPSIFGGLFEYQPEIG
ncbi:MAG: hypothetical protein EZS28_019066 [Streblomastix strix]|uniref:Uncharacterized protein n=1 Tax=Streblomastix strix TaxID=222440 RepID=A0A5J4VTA0_9EUKA|nr:MAG: hypothetical protein EZS28_019066 [Streblomastix strix]